MADGSFIDASLVHGTGHVSELCKDGDDAQRLGDGLHTGRAVLQRAGLADGLRRDRRHQWRDGMHPDDIRRTGKGMPQVCPRAGKRPRQHGRDRRRHRGIWLPRNQWDKFLIRFPDRITIRDN